MKPEDMRVLRARLGWTQAELGDEIGRRHEMISKYESGQMVIPTIVWFACAAVEVGIRRPRAVAA